MILLTISSQSNEFIADGTISMSTVEEKENGIVEVPISIENAENIYSFEGQLSYNGKYLKFKKITESPNASLNTYTSKSNGKIYFAAVASNKIDVTSQLLTAQFEVTNRPEDQELITKLGRIQLNENLVKTDVAGSTNYTSSEKDIGNQKPNEISLKQNYPNPFNPKTTIKFSLASSQYVTLSVYNTLGQKISTITDREMKAGVHTISFDGSGLTSGVYLYRLDAGNYTETKRMLLLK